MMGKLLDETTCDGRTFTKGSLFVVTAYTYEECEDDEEVITALVNDQAVENVHQLWSPEINTFSSRRQRITQSANTGRQYFENGAWQAWLFG